MVSAARLCLTLWYLAVLGAIEEDGAAGPVRLLHAGVSEAGHVRLARADQGRPVLAVLATGLHPADCYPRPCPMPT
jgi:hypothetical protein